MKSKYWNKQIHSAKYPSNCSKPHCNGKDFIRHEDGWQCWNCMKIIYRHPPLPYIPNNHPERIEPYSCKSSRRMKEYNSNNGYLDSVNLNLKDDSELWYHDSIVGIDNNI